jgi:hypothetical protein
MSRHRRVEQRLLVKRWNFSHNISQDEANEIEINDGSTLDNAESIHVHCILQEFTTMATAGR